ncbi:TrmB family transcriptional regulator sugar-binding domain-containing protein [Haloarcula pelagica]|uniref:TrmB family transcriptional regulator sugar-binding domain-containing protein n=1 Tax=Haloarcula pelagica TaxID=3033389 RepID=UPI0024C2FB19|nr:TrmB family transcriptional regulator sugar-binding domain-containing protein [Halomicroarcula sp. YJ-61-S]
MSSDSELVERLQQFGLSETEASVYLAVVECGQATLSTVATVADVSPSYIYDIADALEQYGVVKVNRHQSPTTIRAHRPIAVLGDRVETMRETVSKVDQRYEQPSGAFDALSIVRSRQTLYDRFRQFIDNAESEIFMTLPADALPEIEDELADAVDRGVLVLLAISESTAEPPASMLERVATVVRSMGREITAYLTVDQSTGIISPPSLLDWKHDDAEAVSFHNQSVAAAVEGMFLGTIWSASEELALRRPSPLPRTYQGLRASLYDAVIYTRTGRPVQAEISARPTGTSEEPSSLTGEVVDVTQGFVKPRSAEFGLESSLTLDTGEETVTVGAVGAFFEDYEATEVTLRSFE